MTEILLLPARPRGWDQAERLHADLAAVHARGKDLGTRVPHIQADGERLLELSRTLERAMGDLDLTLNKLGLKDPAMLQAVLGLVKAVEGLASMARRFPSAL